MTTRPSIECEIALIGDAIPWGKVIQETGYTDAHQPEISSTLISAVPVTEMIGCPKASDSPSRKKKGIPQGSAVMDKENQPVKVARHAKAMMVESEDIQCAED